MGTILCALCRKTAVYKAGDRCSTCRYQVRHPETVPESKQAPGAPDAPVEIDLGAELRTTMAMFVDQRQRLGEALAGNGLFQGDTLNEMTKLTRGLEVTVELELKLRKAARGKVQTNDERIDAVAVWGDTLSKQKLERLIQLLQERLAGKR